MILLDEYNGEQPEEQDKKRSNWLVPILIGIAVGILLVLVIYPSLMGSNEDNEKTTGSKNSDESTQTVQRDYVELDVTTQITKIVEEVSPAVVGVTNIQQRRDFWQQQQGDSEAGTGSGVIYKKDNDYAYIVTNHHVIDQADVIEIVLFDDEHVEAELLGSDLFTDLAVLRVAANAVDKVIEMGSSETLKVGEPVIAIGNPLGHMFAGSVTQGIISGKQRTIPMDFNQDGRPDWQAEVLQTDAAINPGNSGGALINIEGQLIGINSMKINQAVAQGIGFAIPIDTAQPIIKELEEIGEVTRPFLGVEIYSLDEVPKTEWRNTLNLPEEVDGGVYIWNIEPLSPADQAGMKRLDVITEFAGEKVLNILELRKILYEKLAVDEEIDVVVYRDGKEVELKVKLKAQN